MAALILLITMVMVIIIVIGFAIPEVRPSPKLMNDTEQPPAPNVSITMYNYTKDGP